MCLRVFFAALEFIFDVFSLGFSDDLLELLAESSVSSSVFWAGVVDSPVVELVLFLNLSFDFWVAPPFSSWFWISFVGLDDTLDGLLDVEEVL